MTEREQHMTTTRINKVEEMRQNTKVAKELFPRHTQHPKLGEFIFMVRQGELAGCSKEEIKIAGEWWLWARTLFIENTMTKPMKRLMEKMALATAQTGQPIHFVTARSPEWIHAQISTQGDPNLPRSKKALLEFSKIVEASSRLLPTIGTVLLADVAIDNLETILKLRPDLDQLITENQIKLESLIEELGFKRIQLARLSELQHPSGKKIGELVNADGSPKIDFPIQGKALKLIETVLKESIVSHQRMFGWTEDQSRAHNTNLGKTMGVVGQAVKGLQPPAILIHNEAFISRGALNNLFTDLNDPLPVICLKTLLERKNQKINVK